MRNKKGFTLVEVMVVVIIIGILASMAVPSFKKARNTALDKAILNNLRQLASAGQQYLIEHGGSSSVNYTDLVGTEDTKHIRVIKQVAGETYTGLTIYSSGGLIGVNRMGGTAVYNLNGTAATPTAIATLTTIDGAVYYEY